MQFYIKELLRMGISEALKYHTGRHVVKTRVFTYQVRPLNVIVNQYTETTGFSYIPTLYGGFPDIFNGLYTTVFTVNRGRIHDANPIYTK